MDRGAPSGSNNVAVNGCVVFKCVKEDLLKKNTISGENLCQSEDAQTLCLYDISLRLKKHGTYDIGGTYTGEESDLWFYYVTTACTDDIYLLSIFAYHRKIGTFSVGISETNEVNAVGKSCNNIIIATENPHPAILSEKLLWKSLVSARSDMSFHIKTYCFDEADIQYLERKILWIPIAVRMNYEVFDQDKERIVKLNHAITLGSMAKRNDKDFVLESNSGKQYPIHKIFFLILSSVFRDMIRDSDKNSIFIDICDRYMEILILFIETGTMKEVDIDTASDILGIAMKFKIQKLEVLMIRELKKVNFFKACSLLSYN